MSNKHYLGYTAAQLEEAMYKVFSGYVDSSEVTTAYNNGYNEGYNKGLEEASPVLQTKTVTPSTDAKIVTADMDYDGLLQVIVEAIPQTFIDDIYNQGYEAGYDAGSVPYKQELEYIECTGTQYIDTGFTPDSNTRVVAEVETITTAPSSNKWLFGCRSSSNTQRYELIYIADANALRFYFNTSYYTFNGVSLGKLSIDVSKSGATINGVTVTPTDADFNGAHSMYIFDAHTANTTMYSMPQKLYSFKIYDNSTLVRDYIPVLTYDDVPCLYDKVDGRFYYNKGTGNFKYTTQLPSGYTQLEYIQSNGTQHIDTGFKPNQNTRVVMKAKLMQTTSSSDSTWYKLFGAFTSSANKFGLWVYKQYTFYLDYASNYKQQEVGTSADVDIDVNKNAVTINGVSFSATATTFQVTNSLHLFDYNAYTNTSYKKAIMCLYSCQIYDNGTLIRDYVPCMSDADGVGLYDLVEGKFYGNAGSGSFAYA